MQMNYEVVRIVDHSVLVNSDADECRYVTPKGVGLHPGFYLVTWDKSGRSLPYNETARYLGPFNSRQKALRAVAM
jgi:hypothetical protein